MSNPRSNTAYKNYCFSEYINRELKTEKDWADHRSALAHECQVSETKDKMVLKTFLSRFRFSRKGWTRTDKTPDSESWSKYTLYYMGSEYRIIVQVDYKLGNYDGMSFFKPGDGLFGCENRKCYKNIARDLKRLECTLMAGKGK